MVSYDTDYGGIVQKGQVDASITRKIVLLCEQPSRVTFTESATYGYIQAGLSKTGVLLCIQNHIDAGGVVVKTIQKTTGKPAYEMFFPVNSVKYYVKVQFHGAGNDMVTISFHPARW